MTLLMICPSRGRPNNVEQLYDSWRLTTTVAHLLIAVDDDDPELEAYRRVTDRFDDSVHLTVGRRERLGPTLNTLSQWYKDDYFALGFLGDDHRLRTPGWDRRLLDTLYTMGTGFVYGNDLLQGPNLPTAIAMTSDIVRTLGWMVPPGLVHLYIDNAWLDLGRELGITYLPDVIIEHMHPVNGKAEWDAGYREVNSDEQTTVDGNAYHRWRANSLVDDVARVREVLGAKAAAPVPDP